MMDFGRRRRPRRLSIIGSLAVGAATNRREALCAAAFAPSAPTTISISAARNNCGREERRLAIAACSSTKKRSSSLLSLASPAAAPTDAAVTDVEISEAQADTTRSISIASTNPTPPSTNSPSRAALWHKERRRQMLAQYGPQISPLERDTSSQSVGAPLLIATNAALLGLAVWSGSLHPLAVLALAAFPGSMLSLWQLQILHDALHGSLYDKKKTKFVGGRLSRKALQDATLFWGSMPSAFGYYLYLKYGHMTHHRSVGDPEKASLAKLFDSDNAEFEDGDVLFVAHRMKLKGDIGPTFNIPPMRKGGKARKLTMSLSHMGFSAWKVMKPLRNVLAFAASFAYERFMLVFNDLVVAISGRNFFFPNKPDQFHRECATYCRCAVATRALLVMLAGWKSLFFLYLSELLWSIPPHPASAMFVTNHGSAIDEDTGSCVPSSSTYAGRLYSLYTLGTNYHVEHHDFPTIPFHKLHLLRQIAPEFYRPGSDDNLLRIMKKAFSQPDYYACMDAARI